MYSCKILTFTQAVSPFVLLIFAYTWTVVLGVSCTLLLTTLTSVFICQVVIIDLWSHWMKGVPFTSCSFVSWTWCDFDFSELTIDMRRALVVLWVRRVHGFLFNSVGRRRLLVRRLGVSMRWSPTHSTYLFYLEKFLYCMGW